ncbi:hypothetical protein RJT34_19308 [Clitoria ternatea]|uniref:Uncharacterized protein n=1 Tax=Clitoria ternatea TaxID=43366 RepID=A0AAN9IR10_CLITE
MPPASLPGLRRAPVGPSLGWLSPLPSLRFLLPLSSKLFLSSSLKWAALLTLPFTLISFIFWRDTLAYCIKSRMMNVREEEEGGQKNKNMRAEEKKIYGDILYIEIDGDLVGINLSGHGSSNLEQISEPPLLPEYYLETFFNCPHEPGKKFEFPVECPIVRHFVIDHKLFLLYDYSGLGIEESLEVFDHLSQRWEIFDGEHFLEMPIDIYPSKFSFESVWLSKIQFPPPINSSSGVVLSIERTYPGTAPCLLRVYALVCSETPGYFDYFQQLDEVFADISDEEEYDDDDINICNPRLWDSLYFCGSTPFVHNRSGDK